MKIIILTGAGISAESGVPTFRSSDGLWSGHKVEEVATPKGYKKNPSLVLDFYNKRRLEVKTVTPNEAHISIANLQNSTKHKVVLITQNVDNLHERAGSPEVIHMHGSLAKSKCNVCNDVFDANEIMEITDTCSSCFSGTLRPDIVWFGEIPYHMDKITKSFEDADLFVAIGTSGNVYPAAGFVQIAKKLGLHTLELNLIKTGNNDFMECREGPASVIVTKWVNQLLELNV